MTEFWQIVTAVSVLSSILLGGMIGALYGYELSPTHRLVYPFRLWAIGGAFITLLAFLATSPSSNVPTGPGYAVGRFFLWTLLCFAIPTGRWLAGRVAILIDGRNQKREQDNGLHR